MKRYTNYRDIVGSYNNERDRWVVGFRPLGLIPARPKFETKAEATEAAKLGFERWLNKDSDDEAVITKPDIPVGQCFKNFLAKSKERAKNPDEKFSLGSQQNHIDNFKAFNKLTIDG